MKDRKAAGSLGARVFRSQADPNEILVITEWPDVKKAQAFAGSPELKEAMEKAGVVGMPDIYFMEEVERQPA